MIAIRSTVNRTLRPNLSVSHPPTKAPRKMPIRAEAPTRPCSVPFRLSWGVIWTSATPMIDKM
jgi:hypothetical protein